MNQIKITEIVSHDILSDKRKFIKKGYLIFNKIDIFRGEIKFYQDNALLAKINAGRFIGKNDTLTLQLNKGSMELSVASI